MAVAGRGAFALDPAQAVTQYIHEVWQAEQGLPQNSVQAILQTRDGYLWLGTQEGLARFDGVRFEVFTKSTTEGGLRDNYIRALAEDGQGNLWVGTNGGGLSRLTRGQVTTFTMGEGLPSNRVLSIVEGCGGGVFVGTASGLARFGSRGLTEYAASEALANEPVLSLHRDRECQLWVGTGQGLAHLENDVLVPVSSGDDFLRGRVHAITETADGSLWLGTNQGVGRLHDGKLTTYTADQGVPEGRVHAVRADHDGNLWLATDSGLLRLQDRGLAAFSSADGLTDDLVLSLFEDRERSLWVGTGGGGLNRLRDGKMSALTTEEGLVSDRARVVYQDRDGDVWIGTDDGLVRLRGDELSTYTVDDGLASNKISSLYQDRGGALWVGTYGSGLVRFSGRTPTTFSAGDGLASNVVTAIQGDQEGRILVGTAAGLSRWDGTSFVTLPARESVADDPVMVILRARAGDIWVGTYSGGLRRYSGGALSVFTAKDGLSNDMVISLHEDQDGVLWIGTLGGGLNRLRDGEISSVSSEDGLFDDNVFQILEDEHGYLWMSCNNGIFRVGKRNLEDFFEGRTERIACVAYDEADGMESAECVGGSQPAGCRTADGRLWFPTVTGVVIVDPAGMRVNTVVPPVVIEDVIADNVTLDGADIVRLSAGSRNVEVHYTALSLVDPQKVRFKYRLGGYDGDWVMAGVRRVAYFSHLPAGKYLLNVVAANNDGVWNTDGATLSLHLAPYFYETTWFRAGSLLLLTMALVAGHKARTRRIKARALELENVVAERTDDLRRYARALEEHSHALDRANARIHAADRQKSRFLATMSHELRTPLNAIIGFSEILSRKLDRQVDPRLVKFQRNIVESGRHLLYLINNILDLSKIEAGKMDVVYEEADLAMLTEAVQSLMTGYSGKRNITIVTRLDPTLPSVITDVPKLKQIMFNLLSNAVKFSPRGGTVELEATSVHASASPLEVASFEVAVTDRGIGIRPEEQAVIFGEFYQVEGGGGRPQGTGLGLAIVQRFLDILGGTVEVESGPGIGSTFRVVLPVDASPHRPRSMDDKASGPVACLEGAEVGRQTVLIVENDRLSFGVLARGLESAGFLSVRARHGMEARGMAKEIRPSVIVVDVAPPAIDGWEALGQLVADPITSSMPVVITTVLERRELGLAIGADGCFATPVDVEAVVARIAQLRPPPAETGNGNVLVIAGGRPVLDSLTDALASAGFGSLVARNGRDGIEKAVSAKPVAAVLDLSASEVNCFEVARDLQRDPVASHISIILLIATELTGADRRRLARDLSSVLETPCSGAELARTVERLASRRPG